MGFPIGSAPANNPLQDLESIQSAARRAGNRGHLKVDQHGQSLEVRPGSRRGLVDRVWCQIKHALGGGSKTQETNAGALLALKYALRGAGYESGEIGRSVRENLREDGTERLTGQAVQRIIDLSAKRTLVNLNATLRSTLHFALRDPVISPIFRDFLAQEHSIGNLDFLRDAECVLSIPDTEIQRFSQEFTELRRRYLTLDDAPSGWADAGPDDVEQQPGDANIPHDMYAIFRELDPTGFQQQDVIDVKQNITRACNHVEDVLLDPLRRLASRFRAELVQADQQ